MDALIIEDNAELAAVWRIILEERGHSVTWARSAREGHTKIATSAFHLVLSDLLLGDASALGILDYARVKNPEARIVLITGSNAYAHGELHSLAPAADWILRKPVSVDVLTAILDYLDKDVFCYLVRTPPNLRAMSA
ncbi:MAG: response regulator [Pseudomonadota bacterium]